MTQQEIQQSISMRIATEFGMKALGLIEAEERYRALEAMCASLSDQVTALTTENAALKAESTALRPDIKET